MADIKDQLIKDSYNYVLQSDTVDGIVYRIGGSIPVNPKFLSGLTINSGFTYSNGTEQDGYVLLTDGTGYAYWGPVSGASSSSGVTSITVGNGLSASSSTGAVRIVFTGSTVSSGDYLPLSGGTVTGDTIFQSGITANTISATTYYNLPISGLTSGAGIGISNLNGNYNISYTGSTGVTGDYLPLSGGTLTGGAIFQSGLTANTISATTYFNLPVSGLTSGSGISVTNNNNNFIISYTGSTGISGDYLPLSGGTVTGGTIFQNGLTANTISATTYFNLPSLYQLTGGTYSSGTIDFTNTTGGTSFSVTGLSKYFVSGSTPTGVTLNDGDRWFDTNSGIEVVWITDVDGSQWIQPTQGNSTPSITGSGTTNKIVKWSNSSGLTNSIVTDNGTSLTIDGNVSITGTTSISGLTTFNTGFTHNNSIGVDRYSGEIIKFGGGSTYASLLYYYDSSGNWSSTNANSSSTSTGMLGIGISPNNSTSGTPTTNGILVRGFARLYYGSWTTGDRLYISDSTSSQLTNTSPSTTGYIVRIVGYVVDGATNLIYFCPDNTWIEIV